MHFEGFHFIALIFQNILTVQLLIFFNFLIFNNVSISQKKSILFTQFEIIIILSSKYYQRNVEVIINKEICIYQADFVIRRFYSKNIILVVALRYARSYELLLITSQRADRIP